MITMKYLSELCALAGISGNEHGVREYILQRLEKSSGHLKTEVDVLGNVIVHVRGEKRAKNKVLFCAHMDEVGFVITDITKDGYLRFDAVGGIDSAVVYARRVLINGQVGVISGKALHQTTKEERKNKMDLDKMLIDIGAESREEAEKIVSLGDVAVFESEGYLIGDDLFKAKALDDRAGCAVLLDMLETVPKYDMVVGFTVQEEVGLRGAKTLGYAVKPDISVVVDSTTAADVCGVQKDKQVCVLGGGAVVPFMDRSTLYNRDLYKFAMKLAKENGILAQTKTAVAGGTDAGALHLAAGGSAVLGVSLPCRYIHSGSSVVSKKDFESTKKLLTLLKDELAVFDFD